MVASGTRKARAISVVVSPPSVRSVSATCASRARDGWQHVKMRRRRSSTMPELPSSSGPPSLIGVTEPAPSMASWRSNGSRSASRRTRRRRSMARLRAVVMIQPAGLGGTPTSGQRRTAMRNASATASSARSKSPRTRIRVASARPALRGRRARPHQARTAEARRRATRHRDPRNCAQLSSGRATRRRAPRGLVNRAPGTTPSPAAAPR